MFLVYLIRKNALRTTLCCSALVVIASGFMLQAFGINASIATKAQIQAFCGTTNVKVLFEYDSAASTYFYYVDFNEATPVFHVVKGVQNGSLAVISPNGQNFSYAQGSTHPFDDGANSNSTSSIWYGLLAENPAVYQVAAIGLVPRFVKNAANDTIIYSTCRNALVPWDNCGTTVKRSLGVTTAGAEVTVKATGSYYGGLSYDNRYMGSAYLGGPPGVMCDLKNLAQGAVTVTKLRVQKNSTNADTIVSSGACNPSISSSKIFTNAMMYLDFGSFSFFENANCHSVLGSWGVHQRLLINRIDGELLKIMGMPGDKSISENTTDSTKIADMQWADPEWTSHPYFIASALMVDRPWKGRGPSGRYDHTTKNEAVYLVNLKDSTTLKILQSNDTTYTTTVDMARPFAYVNIPTNFSEDTCWLKYTMDERISNPANRCGSIGILDNAHIAPVFKGVSLAHGIISSPIPLRSVAVYSVSGQNVAFASPRVNVFALPKLKPAVYLVKIQTVDNSNSIMRMVITGDR